MGTATNEIKNILRGKFLVEGKEANRNWLLICFVFALALIVIASSHIVDKKVHQIAKLNEEVNEFVDVRSRLQRVRLESSLLEQLESKGLKQPEKPPQKIKVIIEE